MIEYLSEMEFEKPCDTLPLKYLFWVLLHYYNSLEDRSEEADMLQVYKTLKAKRSTKVTCS